MTLNQNKFIAISLGPALVKVAQVSKNGVLEKVAKQVMDSSGPAEALRRVLKDFQIAKAGIVCCVPGDVATTKNLDVPSTDPAEIESILSLQATRHTPFNKDEILTSYVKTGAGKSNSTRVLLVVVKRALVQEKLDILKNAGVSPHVVHFIPEGIASFYLQGLNQKKGEVPLALIDVNDQSTNFIVAGQGTMLMSRSIPVGVEHFSRDAEAGKNFIDEVRASLETYEHEEIGARPSKFYVASGQNALNAIEPGLVDVLGGAPQSVPYLAFVKASKAVKDSLTKDFSDSSPLDVIACAVTAFKSQIDLVPQEIKDQRALAEKGRETFKAGVFIIVILSLIGGALLSKLYFKEQFLKNNLIAQYAEQKEDVQNLEGMIAKTRLLRQYLADRDVPLETIRELFELTPDEIYLSNINIEKDGTLSLKGVSASMSRVFNFVTALEESLLFEGVKTKSTATKKQDGKDVATFEIVLRLASSDAVIQDAPASEKAENVPSAGKK